MNPRVFIFLGLLALAPVSAQVFRPDVGRGGRIAPPPPPGAGHGRAEGHAGFPPGAPAFSPWRHPASSFRGGVRVVWSGGYGYPDPWWGWSPLYGYPVDTSSATASGFWLGALAGGIIGHHSGALGHRALPGAVLGAASGALIGSAIDARRAAIPAGFADAPALPPAGSSPRAVAVAVAPAASREPPGPLHEANLLFGRR